MKRLELRLFCPFFALRFHELRGVMGEAHPHRTRRCKLRVGDEYRARRGITGCALSLSRIGSFACADSLNGLCGCPSLRLKRLI